MNLVAGASRAQMSVGVPVAALMSHVMRIVKSIRWVVLALFAMQLLVACGGGGGGGGTSPGPDFTITGQPSDVHVTAGDSARFSVATTGDPLLQWQRKSPAGQWADIAGATAATYELLATQEADSGAQFRARVTSRSNQANEALSSAATLTVDPAPVAPTIAVRPEPRTVFAGEDVTFAVTATGTTLAYRWQSKVGGADWTDLAAGTTAVLALNAVPLQSDGLQYRVVVSNAVGSVTSAAVSLTVNPVPDAPIFTLSPSAAAVAAGSAVTFNAIAVGAPTPTMTWQSSLDGATWTTIAGATGGSYTIPATKLADDGLMIRALATNVSGSVNSVAAGLTVTSAPAAPTIQQQPVGSTTGEGGTAVFHVAAAGTPTPTYQWQVSTDGGTNFDNVNGATSSTLSLLGASYADNGKRYRVIVGNSAATVTSLAAQLSVLQGPAITLQPRDAVWRPGQTDGHFVASAAGDDLLYQWQASTDAGKTYFNIVGATSPVYTHAAGANANVNSLRVKVSNAAGTTTSDAARLAQPPWVAVGPRPTGDDLQGVSWVGANTAVAVGGPGTVLRTTDAGLHWALTSEGESTNDSLLSVAMSGQQGVAVGQRIVQRTSDGGRHWVRVTMPGDPDAASWESVAWSGSNVTIVGGAGRILRSVDGGVNWAGAVSDGGAVDWHAVAFNGHGVGLIVGEDGSVMRSVNGGANWMRVRTGTEAFNGVVFSDATTAFAVGRTSQFNGVIFRSTDGGLTWQAVSIDPNALVLSSISFSSATVGVISSQAAIYRTIDGGLTWTAATTPDFSMHFDVALSPSGIGLSVGEDGAIQRSTDGGATWHELVPQIGTWNNLGIAFGSESVGVVSGLGGTVSQTTDGGLTWRNIQTGASGQLEGVTFADANTVVAAGTDGAIVRSTDGGANWSTINGGSNAWLTDVAFATPKKGAIVGIDAMLYTTDGGVTWRPSGGDWVPSQYAKLSFANATVGIAVSLDGDIARTTDAGATWNRVEGSSFGYGYNGVAFASPSTAIATFGYGFARSTDGGVTWTQIADHSLDIDVTGIRFTSPLEGVAVGSNGRISRSHDGGLTWIEEVGGRAESYRDLAVTPAGVPFAVSGSNVYRGKAPAP